MEFINFVDENGVEKPKIIYTPYVYATIIDCSNHFVIFEETKGKTKVRSVIKNKENK